MKKKSNIKTIFCTLVIVAFSIVVNTDNDISKTIYKTMDVLLGDLKTYEDTAIKVSLSFANISDDITSANGFSIPFPSDFSIPFSSDFSVPLDNPIITSIYGNRTHPLSNEESFHTGIDIDSFDSKEVYAIADGVIKECSFDETYGNFIIIEHKDGYESFYAHLSSTFENTEVLKGEKIGIIGSTGKVTGEHLHLEIKQDGNNIDPCSVINFYEN